VLLPFFGGVFCASVVTARAAVGDAAGALEHAERANALLDAAEIGGTPRLSALSLCASAAALAGDQPAFERYLARAASLAHGGGPELRAFVERMRRSGQLRGVSTAPPRAPGALLGTEVTTTSRAARTRTSRRVPPDA
jgi:hypothetical protein